VQTYLSVSVREQDRSVVLELEGELDLASSPQLEHVLERTRREHPGLMVLDLERLRFIDMAGIRVLLAAQQRAERYGHRLVLANVRHSIRRVMQLASVNGVLTVLETAP